MRKNFYECDRCGKEQEIMNDNLVFYMRIKQKNITRKERNDLHFCYKCYDELGVTIRAFAKHKFKK